MLGLTPATIISRIVTLLIAFTVHEFSHAFVADRLGDDTPRLNGRLTLNPLAHLDLMGSLLLVVAGFGWAKPVPVNPWALRRRTPAGLMWVSLAGPFSNLLLAIIAAVPVRLGIVPNITGNAYIPSPLGFLYEFISLNLILMLFNLIPLAPLDGEKIAEFLLPPSWGHFFETISPYGPIILLVLLFVLPLIGIDLVGWIIYPIHNLIARYLLGIG